MKIAILSRKASLYSTRRLKEAGAQRGHAVQVIEAFRGLGADIRCFMVGNRVIASMKRQAVVGEFRSNLHRGGVAEKIRMTPEERATAKRAASAMGLRVAGVDRLRSNHGPVVMEVNSSPGLEGIERATGLDVAGKIIEFIEANAKSGKQRDTRSCRRSDRHENAWPGRVDPCPHG